MQDAPADGALESVTSAGVTYLLSAGGDRDAILHPARFWVDERSCLRVDVDDTEGYFAVLDPSVIVTSDGIVESDASRHAFDAVTAVESQSIPRGILPPEFEAPCGPVTEAQLWGVGL